MLALQRNLARTSLHVASRRWQPDLSVRPFRWLPIYYCSAKNVLRMDSHDSHLQNLFAECLDLFVLWMPASIATLDDQASETKIFKSASLV